MGVNVNVKVAVGVNVVVGVFVKVGINPRSGAMLAANNPTQ